MQLERKSTREASKHTNFVEKEFSTLRTGRSNSKGSSNRVYWRGMESSIWKTERSRQKEFSQKELSKLQVMPAMPEINL